MHHTLIGKLVALSVEKYYMTLKEKQLKIHRFHGSFRQKSSRPLPYTIESCFGWNHTIHIRKLSESVLCCTTRAVIAALHAPNWAGHAATRGPKFSPVTTQSRHHTVPQRKLRSLKLNYEALEISELRGPFERRVLTHCS